MNTPIAIGVKEAAKMCGVGTTTIRRKVSTGELRALRVGDRVLFRPEDLRVWIDSLASAA